MSLGVCLAGGGVKGAAHIGVLKAMEESNIKIDCISGTSSGSIVAMLYAVGYSSDEIKNIFTENAKIGTALCGSNHYWPLALSSCGVRFSHT